MDLFTKRKLNYIRMNFDILYQTNMTSSKTDVNTGAFHSAGSLRNPHKDGESERSSNSVPFIKPSLKIKIEQELIRLLSSFNTKQPQNYPQQTNISIEESKIILRELAAELNRVLQLKHPIILCEQSKDEECKRLILDWADELRSQKEEKNLEENIERMSKHEAVELSEEVTTVSNQHTFQGPDRRFKEAKAILSNWKNNLKVRAEGSMCLTEMHKTVLRDLFKQRKNGKLFSLLPVMDFCIKIIFLKKPSEKSILSQWFKSEQMFEKAGGLPIPLPVWKLITASSAKVILDPRTANTTLKLSKDGKSVRTKTHEEFNADLHVHSYQSRHMHQYDGWTCVQAKEGYSTGSHYWEVNVSGKCDWRLGVVKESAPHNGFVKMNTTTGYWTLRMQLGHLTALTEPATKLNLPLPSVIGIYLSVEDGQVSFYDKMKRTLIFTFKAEFRLCEKIYPVFGTVETDKAMEIV